MSLEQHNAAFLWDCLATMAEMKFYIQRPNKPIAAEPAFLVYEHKIYLNQVGEVFSFKFKSAALRKIKEVVEHANYPMKLWRTSRPRLNEKPFAENLVERFPEQKRGRHVKVFNV